MRPVGPGCPAPRAVEHGSRLRGGRRPRSTTPAWGSGRRCTRGPPRGCPALRRRRPRPTPPARVRRAGHAWAGHAFRAQRFRRPYPAAAVTVQRWDDRGRVSGHPRPTRTSHHVDWGSHGAADLPDAGIPIWGESATGQQGEPWPTPVPRPHRWHRMGDGEARETAGSRVNASWPAWWRGWWPRGAVARPISGSSSATVCHGAGVHGTAGRAPSPVPPPSAVKRREAPGVSGS